MKIFICILAFAASVHCGLLPHYQAHSSLQIQDTKVIKLIHQTAPQNHHATVPTTPVKVLKLIHESSGQSASIPAAVVFPTKIIKVLHQSAASAPVTAPKIVKLIHQSSPAAFKPQYYAPAPAVQSTKVLKIIKQQPGVPHVIPAEAQNIRVYKVFRQLDGAGAGGSVAASHAGGQIYASSYRHGITSSTPVVKVVKALEKPAPFIKW